MSEDEEQPVKWVVVATTATTHDFVLGVVKARVIRTDRYTIEGVRIVNCVCRTLPDPRCLSWKSEEWSTSSRFVYDSYEEAAREAQGQMAMRALRC